MTTSTMTRTNYARAAVEGLVCHMADAAESLRRRSVPVDRVALIRGGARSAAVREIAPSVREVPVDVPPPGEYVADGAARQAAWTLLGGARPPNWALSEVQIFTTPPAPEVLRRYRSIATQYASYSRDRQPHQSTGTDSPLHPVKELRTDD